MKCIDIGSGYKPYKNWDTLDVNAYCTYSDFSEIDDCSYDIVRVRNVIHHVYDLDDFLTNCKRILRKNGRIVIIDVTEQNYRANLFLDYLWYRFILKNRQIYIHHNFREIKNFSKKTTIGEKLWIELRKN